MKMHFRYLNTFIKENYIFLIFSFISGYITKDIYRLKIQESITSQGYEFLWLAIAIYISIFTVYYLLNSSRKSKNIPKNNTLSTDKIKGWKYGFLCLTVQLIIILYPILTIYFIIYNTTSVFLIYDVIKGTFNLILENLFLSLLVFLTLIYLSFKESVIKLNLIISSGSFILLFINSWFNLELPPLSILDNSKYLSTNYVEINVLITIIYSYLIYYLALEFWKWLKYENNFSNFYCNIIVFNYYNKIISLCLYYIVFFASIMKL